MMGQWAQRKRTGGGGVPSLNSIQVAQVIDVALIQLTYSKPVDANQLDSPVFETGPTGIGNTGAIQVTPTIIRITMENVVTGETSLTYSGAVPGLLTPQTVSL